MNHNYKRIHWLFLNCIKTLKSDNEKDSITTQLKAQCENLLKKTIKVEDQMVFGRTVELQMHLSVQPIGLW